MSECGELLQHCVTHSRGTAAGPQRHRARCPAAAARTAHCATGRLCAECVSVQGGTCYSSTLSGGTSFIFGAARMTRQQAREGDQGTGCAEPRCYAARPSRPGPREAACRSQKRGQITHSSCRCYPWRREAAATGAARCVQRRGDKDETRRGRHWHAGRRAHVRRAAGAGGGVWSGQRRHGRACGPVL